MNRRIVYMWAKLAVKAIDKDWIRCDRESRRECRGVYCRRGEHRALAYLCRIMEHMAKNLIETGKQVR